jgi:hypothetical protein
MMPSFDYEEDNVAFPNSSDVVSAELPVNDSLFLDEIIAKNKEVRRAEVKWTELKADASAAKKDFDNLDMQLRELISQGPDPQMQLDFPEEPAEVAENDMRGATIDALEMTPSIESALSDLEIYTVGDMLEFIEKHGDEWADKIHNLGEVGKDALLGAIKKLQEEE